MKIKTLRLRGYDFSKIIGEVLRSLNIETVKADAVADFDRLEIFNEVIGAKIVTRIKVLANGVESVFKKSSTARPDERFGAEVNRLVKKNLYQLLADNFGLDYVPYGILHGVRPTKIIQRWLGEGYGVTSHGVIDRDKICRRIRSDYLTARDKAELLTEVSIRQLPILNSGDKKTVGVYVGIPFCKTRCLYCSFPSHVLPDDNKIAEFMTVLTRDIEAAADEIKRYGFKVQTIYVGGGTPTALPENFFAAMLETVHKNFYGESVEEFTVEGGRPDTITAEKISVMKNFDVTRVSVNPQTMQQRTLDFIGRKHTVEDFTRAFNELRAASDWKINTDLILGLPGERFDDFKDSLEKVLALEPDDITLHALAIKRGSKLQVRIADELNKLEDFNLPSDNEVRKMEEFAEKILRGKNYLPYYLYRQGYSSGQIENVGWCKRGAEGIYNIQMMGERQTILGTGGAASTKVPDPVNKKIQTAFNAKDLTTYLRDIEKYIGRRENILAEVYRQVDSENSRDDNENPADDNSNGGKKSSFDKVISAIDDISDVIDAIGLIAGKEGD
ncbi:MAG: coproporphyrinogen dehydrogenase HemZ [Selenomonadaceae bacterium]|nr:coproporphyrinogen dehydrogenase HemZ [Selenomonadaceae bacterium]